jgi:2-oxoisovalerate dehydrogenase E1 component
MTQTATTEPTYRDLPAEELVEDFRLALVSRALDDREKMLQTQSKVFFQISGAGHESLLLGLARSLRPGYDWFFPYYRDRALMLGLGMKPTQILLQSVGSADDPSSGGRQMPSHWGDKGRNVVSQSSPTGSQCLPAVGCAEAARYISRRPHLPGTSARGDEVTYVSLGEGATSEGEFWESLNTACTLHLPVLFVVADNGYAISVPASDQAPAPISELVLGFRGLDVHAIDGCDYFEVREKGALAISRVRAGVGPALIHATVTRPYSHSGMDTQSKYRLPEELAEEASQDPLLLLERELVQGGVLSGDDVTAMKAEAKRVCAQAATEALAAARPDPSRITEHVLALPEVTEGEAGSDGPPATMLDAINKTLHSEMARDERIRVWGEDVADAREQILESVDGKGGVFGVTHGLQKKFGQARCYNAPLAEANIIGRAVGQGIRGLHPCVEIQFFDYIWPAMQQIKSEAATMRWRSHGAFPSPMTIRVPIGGYLVGGSIWHSQCGESIFTHIPGLVVVMPSRARDAAGLLRTALRAEDPVLFLEHKRLYRQQYATDPLPHDDYLIPFGKGAVVQPGNDVTLVTYAYTTHLAKEAARRLGEEGVSVEVIDLRSLIPWDKDLVAESVRKTGRLLVVHEDIRTCGFGAEVAAWAAEELFWDLDAPVMRVGSLDTHVPYEPTLEDAVLPQVDDIEAALRKLTEA